MFHIIKISCASLDPTAGDEMNHQSVSYFKTGIWLRAQVKTAFFQLYYYLLLIIICFLSKENVPFLPNKRFTVLIIGDNEISVYYISQTLA